MMSITQKLKNLKVKNKLTVLAGSLVGGLLILGLSAFLCAGFMNQKTEDLAEGWMASALMANEMDTLTSNYRLLQYAHMSSADEKSKSEYKNQLDSVAEEISAVSAKYESILLSEEDRVLLMATRQSWSDYKELSAQVIELSNSGNTQEAANMMLGECKTLYDQFGEDIDALVKFNEDGADVSAADAKRTYTFAVVIIVVVLVVSILVSAVVSGTVTKSITAPLEEVHTILGKISTGSLEVKMEYESKDEFGELANDINSFAQALKEIIIDENALLLEMSKGNFNVKSGVTERYIGDYEPILTSMRAIKNKLGGTMERISDSTDQVLVASEQMSEEAQSLADGATEQASTVEELLATVEEVTGQAASGAKQADEASSSANTVRKQAESSNERMKEMIGAMDKINETSKEISTIIQAIESIASQTNLLSLNASIEAARAGEAGRGFAVVADEIGKLALQCSEAAGNTKNLIETAMVHAENGDKIAKAAADELFSVTEGIRKIVDIANEVRINCENQANSMKQIDQGIEIISKVVEGNSAAAEESSAASEELAAHAQNLQEQMSAFKF